MSSLHSMVTLVTCGFVQIGMSALPFLRIWLSMPHAKSNSHSNNNMSSGHGQSLWSLAGRAAIPYARARARANSQYTW
jgi:hypothetical protein